MRVALTHRADNRSSPCPRAKQSQEERRGGAFLAAGRRAETRNRGRLLARKPRVVAWHQAPARIRATPLTSGKRVAGRVTVGCSPRKRHGAAFWLCASGIEISPIVS
ncbi:MAG: hypothetical protein WDO72_07200 [Pseudomonadota bacterium]